MVRIYYRAAQLNHSLAMEIYQYLLPVSVAGVEMFIIFAFFAAIRLNTYANEKFLALVALSAGALGFFIFKQCIDLATKVTDSSRDFCRIPFLQKGSRFVREDKVFLASCQPLLMRIGHTFTIEKQSFPTISQDIILGTLVNLLITF